MGAGTKSCGPQQNLPQIIYGVDVTYLPMPRSKIWDQLVECGSDITKRKSAVQLLYSEILTLVRRFEFALPDLLSSCFWGNDDLREPSPK